MGARARSHSASPIAVHQSWSSIGGASRAERVRRQSPSLFQPPLLRLVQAIKTLGNQTRGATPNAVVSQHTLSRAGGCSYSKIYPALGLRTGPRLPRLQSLWGAAVAATRARKGRIMIDAPECARGCGSRARRWPSRPSTLRSKGRGQSVPALRSAGDRCLNLVCAMLTAF